MSRAARFALNPELDVAGLRAAYAARGRVRIGDVLAPETAAALREHLAARADWRQVVNSGDKVFELDRATRAAMTEAQRRALDEAVAAGARETFQYRYETLRVPDGRAARGAADDLLVRFAAWLSGGAALAALRAITGADDVTWADAQGTAYSPGDLLTQHDDAVTGKDRRAAFVLGLNPVWRADWGGLLLFHRPDGAVEGYSPGHNTLDLFAVPQVHSVSPVTASAPYRRYAVTGWLRAQPQPA